MKFSSFFMALVVGSVSMILFPLWTISLNTRFNLPVYDHIVMKSLGLVSLLVGATLFTYCSVIFKRRGKGTPVPIEPPRKLVITGIYQYIRNPIYLSYWMMVLGEFLLFGHLLLLVYLLLFIAINHLGIVALEEPQLKKRFGDSYNNYTQKVPRYFPKSN